MNITALRYFNVFGPNQNPEGPYAAVIPKWIDATLNNQQIEVYGDGLTSRDFCYIDNVVEANILSSLRSPANSSSYQVLNIACESTTSLKDLAGYIQSMILKKIRI